MECSECGDGEAQPMKVEYIEAAVEQLPLCEECTQKFEDGNLVESVTPLQGCGVED